VVHTEESNLPTSQFGFRAHHNNRFQCTGLMDHDSLNFNNNMSAAAVFLDMKKAFDTSWHTDLLHKLSELKFSTSLIKNISSFLTKRKFKFSKSN
jgi:hypothetical protein